MTRRMRTALSLVSGWILGCLGGFIVLVFGPLLFLLPLNGDSSHGDNMLMLLLFSFFFCFGIGGFLICWRYTLRFEDRERGTGRIFTD
jgi:hypothetical protein